MVIESFFNIEDHIPQLCAKAKLSNLSIEDTDALRDLLNIFDFYARKIKEFEKKDARLSGVLPTILSLVIYLRGVTNMDCFDLCQSLMEDLIS